MVCARTPFSKQRVRERQGLYLAAACKIPFYKKFILSVSTLKNKLMYHFYIRIKQYQKLQISKHGEEFRVLIGQILRTKADVARDSF
jgi:hypothetical protein